MPPTRSCLCDIQQRNQEKKSLSWKSICKLMCLSFCVSIMIFSDSPFSRISGEQVCVYDNVSVYGNWLCRFDASQGLCVPFGALPCKQTFHESAQCSVPQALGGRPERRLYNSNTSRAELSSSNQHQGINQHQMYACRRVSIYHSRMAKHQRPTCEYFFPSGRNLGHLA